METLFQVFIKLICFFQWAYAWVSFLMLSVQAVESTPVLFITGKLLSTFEDEFVFLASVKFHLV